MNKSIDISICILTCNRRQLSQAYIPRIIDSIGNVNYEVLIWDNCSNDGTYDWLEEYGRADCRVTKVFSSDKNIGLEAFNNLAEAANGKYLLKVDDDITVPNKFAQRLLAAYTEINEPRLLFLGWDMVWNDKTFATRSGMRLYKEPLGKIVNCTNGRVLINYDPTSWMVNGVCRFGPKDGFLKIGGHPPGIIYGVDYSVSKRAGAAGYYIGFFQSNNEVVIHRGVHDSEYYRQMKDTELIKSGSPKHV